MIWVIGKEFTFEASHQLPKHDGKCKRLHGHSWKGVIYIASDHLIQSGSKSGMVMDFSDLKSVMRPLLDNFLDHHHLNETLNLEHPTSENVAKWIYDKLEPFLGEALVAVRIDETCTSQCIYSKRIDGSYAIALGGQVG